MPITYRHDVKPDIQQVIDLYKSSGITRPTDDFERIKKMYDNSNLVVTAWDGDKLVGVSRALTDFCYCCYLSDLAVSGDYQKQGIGKKLIELTKEQCSPLATLILLSAKTAMGYYPKVGLEYADNAFLIRRER